MEWKPRSPARKTEIQKKGREATGHRRYHSQRFLGHTPLSRWGDYPLPGLSFLIICAFCQGDGFITLYQWLLTQ